jgi:hypothetical protein
VTFTNGALPRTPPLGQRRPPANNAQRDRTISKLAVLKAAAEFGSSRPDMKSGDVLRVADVWLRWILEGGKP